MPNLPKAQNDVHFPPGKPWRENSELKTESDPDDEELAETPKDVVEILGFDPKTEATTPPEQSPAKS